MLTTIYAGLVAGSIYASVALGFCVVYTTTGVFNFAQPQFLMMGTFLAYVGYATLHLPPPVVFLLCIGGVAALGLVTEQIAIGPLQGSGVHAELVTTIGVATIIDGVAGVIWGQNPLQVPFFASNAPLTVLSGRITPDEIVIVVAVCVLVIALNTWSKVTLFGLASLAVSENRRAATLRGISARRYSAVAVVLTGAFSGALGPLLGPETYAATSLPGSIVIGGFVALVIGGFESKLGALGGGLALGVVEAITGRYAGEEYQNLIIFGLLLVLLLSRPHGLLARHERVV